MFGLVGYTMASFAVGCVLTLIVGLFRPIKQNDDWKPWKYILIFMGVVCAIPYGYTESLTAMFGKPMKDGVQQALDDAQTKGDLIYYKVVQYQGEKAKVIAVANDKNEVGYAERAIFEVDLEKGKNGWNAASYETISSFSRQRDGTTMPPYW